MSKIGAIIGRNLKIILRSKAQAVIILVAPLLIIMAVGLALNTGQQDIVMGYHVPDQSGMAESFLDTFSEDEFTLNEYKQVEDCRRDIGVSKIQLCLLFPQGFSIQGNSTVRFLVDNSKVNYYRAVVDEISTSLNERARNISSQLTDTLLRKLNETSTGVANNSRLIAELKEGQADISGDINDTRQHIREMQLHFDPGSFELEELQFHTLAEKIRGNAEDAINTGEDVIGDTRSLVTDLHEQGSLNDSERDEMEAILDSAEEEFEESQNNLDSDLENSSHQFQDAISQVQDKLEELDQRLAASSDKRETTLKELEDMSGRVSEMQQQLATLQQSLTRIMSSIKDTEITQTSTIVDPIEHEVRPVAANQSQLHFYFPYLIVLVISFVGMLLASSLVLLDKSSSAYFRNLVTPTQDSSFLLGTFFTTLLILSIQIAILLAIYIGYFGEHMAAYQSAAVVLLIVASIFIGLGMLLGNIFTSQETNMLASISLACIMVFLSDLVYPLERMPAEVASIIQNYNPFYIGADVLRKTMVHDIDLYFLSQDIMVLLGILLAVACLAFFGHKLAKRHILLRFSGFTARRDAKKMLKKANREKVRRRIENLTQEEYFVTEDGTTLKNLADVLSFIEQSDRRTFSAYVNSTKNLFADWISHKLGHEYLANRMYRTVSQRRIIKLLREELESFKQQDQ